MKFKKVLTALVLSGCLTAGVCTGSFVTAAAENKEDMITTTETTGEKLSVEQVASEALTSTVCISTKSVEDVRDWFTNRVYQSEVEGGGSGIIYQATPSELLIITNSHVIQSATEVSVAFNDESTYEGYVKGFDEDADIGIVAVPIDEISEDTLSVINVSKLGDSDELNLGEQVVAIGNALGCGQSVTVGYVGALGRKLEDDGLELIQTDAAINSGNSGGALLNMEGEVIGINSYKYASTGVEGMGYAIPISSVMDIVEDLSSKETRTEIVAAEDAASIGVSVTDVTSEVQKYYNIPKGVYIQDVNEGGAASKAGMKKGQIIVKFNGEKVSSISGLKNILQYYKAGEEVEIVVKEAEEGEYVEKTVVLTLDHAENAEDEREEEKEKEENVFEADDTNFWNLW